MGRRNRSHRLSRIAKTYADKITKIDDEIQSLDMDAPGAIGRYQSLRLRRAMIPFDFGYALINSGHRPSRLRRHLDRIDAKQAIERDRHPKPKKKARHRKSYYPFARIKEGQS